MLTPPPFTSALLEVNKLSLRAVTLSSVKINAPAPRSPQLLLLNRLSSTVVSPEFVEVTLRPPPWFWAKLPANVFSITVISTSPIVDIKAPPPSVPSFSERVASVSYSKIIYGNIGVRVVGKI